MTETVTYLEAATLVPLGEMYPRGEESESHVSSLAEALYAGANLPPIVVCKKTHRVVDGQHRLHAHVKVYGEDCSIPCILRLYASEEDLFADALRENAKHGLRLGRADLERCVALAGKLRITPEKLAPLLQVTAKTLTWAKVSGLRPRVRVEAEATAPPNGGANYGRRGASAHEPDEDEEEEEEDEFRGAKDGSKRPAFDPKDKLSRAQHYAQNLTLLLENRLVDNNYRELVRDVAKLKIAINEYLARGQA